MKIILTDHLMTSVFDIIKMEQQIDDDYADFLEFEIKDDIMQVPT